MKVTWVKTVWLEDPRSTKRLRGIFNVEIDGCLVIRGVKLIDIEGKGLTLCMPSRRLHAKCRCGSNVWVRDRFCSSCGAELDPDHDANGYEDIVFPLDNPTRRMITDAVLAEYHRSDS